MQQQFALKPIEPDYAKGLYTIAYESLFTGTGKQFRDEWLYIRPEDYANGWLYAFDLTADLGVDDHFSLVRQGNVRLGLKLGDALPETISVVVYAEFEKEIEVDRDRNVIFDFGVWIRRRSIAYIMG